MRIKAATALTGPGNRVNPVSIGDEPYGAVRLAGDVYG